MKRAYLISAVSLVLAGCSIVPQSDYQPQQRDYRSSSNAEWNARSTAERAPSGSAAPRLAAATAVAMRPAEAQCLSNLGNAGVSFDALPNRYLDEGCSNLNTVQMHALQGDSGRLDVSNLGPVTCPVSTAFAAWARFGVDRAARQIFGTRLASIQTMGSYSCRNVAGTGRRSAHASANAIDIAGFILADGRRISVQDDWNGSAEEREFLRVVQRSACRRFNTVLGPDYNAAHRDHFHFEGVIDGNSYCR
ncbi:extensin-like domain-containing protein [Aurantiacibacter sediminis]|uniref:Extensin family protein n=1 Tax=Aurantiacibacter sediminis TaxID=2793064 RepID=A0ABS0N257_9SPHN|nr:extensin family protein [Aurantiacibacter sediminis]MBH5322048.1 extensin family protein [Aurantiacibacter sediminis]